MTEPAARLFVLGSFVMACSAGVDRLPEAGESLVARSFTAEAGGKGFNVAVGARRLGAAVDCMMAVGADPFGQLAEAALAKADLSPRYLRRTATPTGAGIGFVRSDGENCLAVFPGANRALSAADVAAAAAAVTAAPIVVAQFEIDEAPILAAFTLARAAGHATLLNPSPFRPLSPALLAATTILVVNETEAAALHRALDTPDDSLAALAAAVQARGVETLVVTLGARGATAFAPEAMTVEQPAFPVTSVDTLGAGDAFLAAFAVSLLEGRDLAEAVRRGGRRRGPDGGPAGNARRVSRSRLDRSMHRHGLGFRLRLVELLTKIKIQIW